MKLRIFLYQITPSCIEIRIAFVKPCPVHRDIAVLLMRIVAEEHHIRAFVQYRGRLECPAAAPSWAGSIMSLMFMAVINLYALSMLRQLPLIFSFLSLPQSTASDR